MWLLQNFSQAWKLSEEYQWKTNIRNKIDASVDACVSSIADISVADFLFENMYMLNVLYRPSLYDVILW